MGMPEHSEKLIDLKTQEMIENMQDAIETGRFIRDAAKVNMKFPLGCVKLVDSNQATLDGYKKVESYIKEELNCMKIEYDKAENKYLQYTVEADRKVCGKTLGKKLKEFEAGLAELDSDKIKNFLKTKKM